MSQKLFFMCHFFCEAICEIMYGFRANFVHIMNENFQQ